MSDAKHRRRTHKVIPSTKLRGPTHIIKLTSHSKQCLPFSIRKIVNYETRRRRSIDILIWMPKLRGWAEPENYTIDKSSFPLANASATIKCMYKLCCEWCAFSRKNALNGCSDQERGVFENCDCECDGQSEYWTWRIRHPGASGLRCAQLSGCAAHWQAFYLWFYA